MSDWFQTIADIDVGPSEAVQAGAAVLEWLITSGVVVAEVTDRALGDGHAPGPNFADAVREPDPNVMQWRTNGMKVIVGRTVFHSMDADRVTCPHCGSAIELHDDQAVWNQLLATISAWYDGGQGNRACWVCGRTVGLNSWDWDPPWGFGYLGFQFWNWPPLQNQFVTEVAQRLGHRVVLPRGKL